MIPYKHLSLANIFDSSDNEVWVMDNNPKLVSRITKQLKSYKKAKKLEDSYDPYKYAYDAIPSYSA